MLQSTQTQLQATDCNVAIHTNTVMGIDRNAAINTNTVADTNRNAAIHTKQLQATDCNAAIHTNTVADTDRNAAIHTKQLQATDCNAAIHTNTVTNTDRNAAIHTKQLREIICKTTVSSKCILKVSSKKQIQNTVIPYLGIMLWTVVLCVFLSVPCLAQEKADTSIVVNAEWENENFTQEDKIYNRSVWTFVDNPALAGFDRKLAVAYRFRMKNLAMGVPNEEGNLELAFMKHELFLDLSFGARKQNWGAGIYYANEKELTHTIQRIEAPVSFRISIQNHHIIAGLKVGFQLSDIGDWDQFTFSDMFDPRYGLVYQTNEYKRSGGYNFGYYGGGIKYYWKRFSFDYAVQQTPSDGFAISWIGTTTVRNRFKASYLFNVGDDVTIAPEVAAEVRSMYIFSRNDPNNLGFFSAFGTITYKDMAYGQLGIVDLNRFTFRAGYQLKDYLVIEIGGSSYLNETMKKIAGLAGVDIGIRYQIKPWFR